MSADNLHSYPVVYFDESGNTGQDLLNREQPVLVIASHSLSTDTMSEVLNILESNSNEVKFSHLIRTNSGRKKILDAVSKIIRNHDRVKISVTHKIYYTITKIVDVIIEEVAHRDGLDLYKDQANIGYSLVLYFSTPAHCGRALFDRWVGSFISFIRIKSTKSRNEFLKYTMKIIEKDKAGDFSNMFLPILKSGEILDELCNYSDKYLIDPATSPVVTLCGRWSEEFKSGFIVVHDESRAFQNIKPYIEFISTDNTEDIVIGYDTRKLPSKLKIKEIHELQSVNSSQIQISDILAGAACYVLREKCNVGVDAAFSNELENAGVLSFVRHSIWPDMDWFKRQIPKTDPNDINPVDHFVGEMIKRGFK